MGLIDEHYEKVALAVGGMALVACIGLGVMGSDSTSAFIEKNNGDNGSGQVAPILDLQRLKKAIVSLNTDNVLRDKYVTMENKRKLYLLQSIPLHGLQGNKMPQDLLDPNADSVHKGIPNAYWHEYGIQNLMGLDNGPKLDPDKDGFSVQEEFDAKTHPNDDKSYPDLLAKLGIDGVKVNSFQLSFNLSSGSDIYLHIKNSDGLNDEEPLKMGNTGPNRGIFKEFKGRFKYLERLKEQEVGGLRRPGVLLEDLKNMNRKLQVFRGLNKKVQDRKAVFYIDALGQGNEPGFAVPEGAKFSLPYDAESKNKKYLLKQIRPIPGANGRFEVEVQGPSGETRVLKAQLIK